MSEPKYRRKDGALHVDTDSNPWCGVFEGMSLNYRAEAIDALIADANYGAAIREFAVAAEDKIQEHCFGINREGEHPMTKAGTENMREHLALKETLALLPAAEPASPTLAEQGEEIKKFIDVVAKSWYSAERTAQLRHMVDALVAGGKA